MFHIKFITKRPAQWLQRCTKALLVQLGYHVLRIELPVNLSFSADSQLWADLPLLCSAGWSRHSHPWCSNPTCMLFTGFLPPCLLTWGISGFTWHLLPAKCSLFQRIPLKMVASGITDDTQWCYSRFHLTSGFCVPHKISILSSALTHCALHLHISSLGSDSLEVPTPDCCSPFFLHMDLLTHHLLGVLSLLFQKEGAIPSTPTLQHVAYLIHTWHKSCWAHDTWQLLGWVTQQRLIQSMAGPCEPVDLLDLIREVP